MKIPVTWLLLILSIVTCSLTACDPEDTEEEEVALHLINNG